MLDGIGPNLAMLIKMINMLLLLLIIFIIMKFLFSDDDIFFRLDNGWPNIR